MKEITFEENKQIQISILKTFIKFCEDNHLSYFIAYGSLIGAIRHNGFIPWDDDIDVQMPRPDYDKLIDCFNKQQQSSYYHLVSPYDKIAQHPYVKITDARTIKIEKGIIYKNDYLGIDIDVFPVDALPDTQKEYDFFYKKMKGLYKKFAYSKIKTDGNSIKEVLLRLYQFAQGDSRHIVKKAEKILKRSSYVDSKYVGTLISFDDYYNDYHEKADYSSYTLLSFEGVEVRAPIGYDRILKRLYGNYMELPPIEEQVTHHSYLTYWND